MSLKYKVEYPATTDLNNLAHWLNQVANPGDWELNQVVPHINAWIFCAYIPSVGEDGTDDQPAAVLMEESRVPQPPEQLEQLEQQDAPLPVSPSDYDSQEIPLVDLYPLYHQPITIPNTGDQATLPRDSDNEAIGLDAVVTATAVPVSEARTQKKGGRK